MKIKMLISKFATEDGFTIRSLEQGQDYQVKDWLGIDLIDKKKAIHER